MGFSKAVESKLDSKLAESSRKLDEQLEREGYNDANKSVELVFHLFQSHLQKLEEFFPHDDYWGEEKYYYGEKELRDMAITLTQCSVERMKVKMNGTN